VWQRYLSDVTPPVDLDDELRITRRMINWFSHQTRRVCRLFDGQDAIIQK